MRSVPADDIAALAQHCIACDDETLARTLHSLSAPLLCALLRHALADEGGCFAALFAPPRLTPTLAWALTRRFDVRSCDRPTERATHARTNFHDRILFWCRTTTAATPPMAANCRSCKRFSARCGATRWSRVATTPTRDASCSSAATAA